MKNSADSYEIVTITRAFSVLEELSKHQTLGVTELSTSLGIHKNNVFRILSTFAVNGYVVQDKETEKYRLTSKLGTLVAGHNFQNSSRVSALAQQIVDLVQEGETGTDRVELSVDEERVDTVSDLL